METGIYSRHLHLHRSLIYRSVSIGLVGNLITSNLDFVPAHDVYKPVSIGLVGNGVGARCGTTGAGCLRTDFDRDCDRIYLGKCDRIFMQSLGAIDRIYLGKCDRISWFCKVVCVKSL